MLEHDGFGTMNGTDGKPFKTREGGVMKLYDLIAMATAEADARLTEQGLAKEYPPEERIDIAPQSRHRRAQIRRSVELPADRLHLRSRTLHPLRGKTGPYLQYAAVRVQSILRKMEQKDLHPPAAPSCALPEERGLILQLLALPEAMIAAEARRAPNILCEYVFELAQRFSRFYAQHHVLSEPDDAVRGARLGLCGLTLAVLTKVLFLLGIEVPERM